MSADLQAGGTSLGLWDSTAFAGADKEVLSLSFSLSLSPLLLSKIVYLRPFNFTGALSDFERMDFCCLFLFFVWLS